MLKYKEFEQFYYKSFKIFNTVRTPDEIGMTFHTAEWINRLAGRQVFDKEFFENISTSSDNEQLVEYYNFMLEELLKRDGKLRKLKEKFSFHIIVSDFLEISTNVLQDDAVIVIEWPFIKYIDLLNKETMYSEMNEFVRNVKMIFQHFATKYRDGEKTDRLLHLHIHNDPIVFQMCSYMRNIQELFMIGHELGHLMLRESKKNTEEAADKIAFEGVFNYCKRNKIMMPLVMKSIMLLFVYMTWLEVARTSDDDLKKEVIDRWMDRYDCLFEEMEPYYTEMDNNGKEEIDNCDMICNLIQKIGYQFLEED